MKLLFVGDLAQTGFGTVTMGLGKALLDIGHDVRFLSQNELGELEEPFRSRTFVVNDERDGWLRVLQFREQGLAASLIDGTAWHDGWTADAALILGDVVAARTFMHSHPNDAAALAKIPVAHYVPIEGIMLPPSWAPLWRSAIPVAMSRFGAEQIAKLTGRAVPVAYHGVDTAGFWPVSAARPIRIKDQVLRTKEECKRFFNLPPCRLLLRVDANVRRKNYPGLLRAVAPVLATRPDTALLWHTSSLPPEAQDGDLRDLVSFYGPLQGRMGSTGYHDRNLGMSRELLNVLYNAADVYVSPGSEGFGLTIAEALACGVPAVGMDFSAVPEVIGPAGLLAPVASYTDAYAHLWGNVDEEAFGRQVAHLLDTPNERGYLGALGPSHIARNFTWAKAAAVFDGVFQAALNEEVAA
jgi:glycosyltransferase involved in cell wall biosynthesis